MGIPITLYRHILNDLLRLFIVSLLVIVGVLAFGFAIPTIADGILQPLQVLRLVMYLMPMMLPYAVPVAAAFATTVTFYRMGADNEITACAAAGISYFQMLLPVILIGCVLTGAMFYVSNWVIPDFAERVKSMIQEDIVSFVIRKIQRRESVKMGKMIIFAESAREVPVRSRNDGSGIRVVKTILLRGVAIGEYDDRKMVHSDYAADVARIDLYEIKGQLLVSARLEDVTGFDPDAGSFSLGQVDLSAIELPSPLKTEIEFLSLTQLRRLLKDPDDFPKVQDEMKLLAKHIALKQVAEALEVNLSDPEKRETFSLVTAQDEQVVFGAAPVLERKGGRVTLEGDDNQRVLVKILRNGRVQQRLEAARVELNAQNIPLAEEPLVDVKLYDVDVKDPESHPPITQRREAPLGRLRIDHSPNATLLKLDSLSLIEAATPYRTDKRIDKRADELRVVRGEVYRKVHSQLHLRSAMPLICLFSMLIAAVMAMILREAVPLAIFFFSFLPTIGAIVMIAGGQNVIGGQQIPLIAGIAVSWSGPAMMATLVLLIFLKLRKN